MEFVALLETVRSLLGGVVAVIGVAFLLAGAIGVLRFPDFYTRLHAANAGHMVGAPIVLIGLAIMAPDWAIALRLLLLAVLLLSAAPILAHVLANTGHAAGLSPLIGNYVAPRPGARRP